MFDRKEYMRRWRLKNKDYRKEYYIKNKEHEVLRYKKWALENKENVRKRMKIWYLKTIETRKANTKKYYAKHREERKKYRFKNRERMRVYGSKRQKSIRENGKLWMLWAKFFWGDQCSLCKGKYLLCFHHKITDTKIFNIGREAGKVSSQRFLNELHKCILMCRSCHVRIHRANNVSIY